MAAVSPQMSTLGTRGVEASVRSARFTIPPMPSSRHAKALLAQVRQALEDGKRDLVIDCEGWSELDLGVLSSLIQCAVACREQGASFEVTNMSSDIRQGVHDLQLAGRLSATN